MIQDLKSALRQLRKSPGFTAVAVLTLALGIGANTAIFSIVNGVLLKPLPYPEPERIVTVWERNSRRGVDQDRVSGPNYLDWQKQNHVFSSMAVSPGWQGSGEFNLVLTDGIRKIKAAYVSSSFFTTLGVEPILGRSFLPEEDQKGGNRAAVLSFGLWQRHFGTDSNVIGRTIILDTYGRREYTIVGVMPREFGVPSPSELWLPLGWMGVVLDERRAAHWHNVIARLKPGVSLAQARAEMNTIQAGLAQQYPEALIGSEVSIVPLLEQALGRNMRLALLVLWAAVGAILLIACANVANLLLARAADRQQEIAVRAALGASRWRVVRQLLIESCLLAITGGSLGILLAWWSLELFLGASPGQIPRLQEVRLDGFALMFTGFASMFTGLIFGLAPAWQFSQPDLNQSLKQISRGGSAGLPATRVRNLLVVSEVALSLILLIAAGLMVRSFARLTWLDRGFEPEHLITAELDYSVSGFTTWVQPTATRPQITQRELIQRLRQRPGVVAAAVTGSFPRQSDGPLAQTILIEGVEVGPKDDVPRTRFQPVSPDYFRAMGIPISKGRDVTEGDELEAAQVALINQTMARRYFPNVDPIGKRLAMPDRNNPRQPVTAPGDRTGPWREIIGVVGDMKNLSLRPEPVPQTYVPYWQWPMQSPTLVVRFTGDPAVMTRIIRDEIKAVVPNLPPPLIRTMENVLAETMAQPRFQTWLLSLFGIVALLLAAVGLYGVLAYGVSQRTREIGIRMALGAQKGGVLALVLRHGMRLALVGVLIGLGGGFALTRVMRSLLYEVNAADPLTYAAVSGFLIAVALAACWLPAGRAARVDPMQALRYE